MYDSNVMTPTEHYPELAKAIGISDLYFKREDLHAYGSHKGRSIPVMIDHYLKKGEHNFAISSSGNAALAAALYIKEKNFVGVNLDIFVGNHITPHKFEKLQRLSGENIRVLRKERPLQALTQAVNEGARSLRQSQDDTALLGYETLAKEITEQKDVRAVFIGTSSGTTAQALAQFFLDKKIPIQVHIVQTSYCHPIFDAISHYEGPDETSLADAIVDQIASRKSALVGLTKETGGTAWCASNNDIETAIKLTQRNTGLSISPNSSLSVVGAMQAAYQGYQLNGAVLCVICGE